MVRAGLRFPFHTQSFSACRRPLLLPPSRLRTKPPSRIARFVILWNISRSPLKDHLVIVVYQEMPTRIKRLLRPATPSLADETLKDHLVMVVVEETPTASEMKLFLILNSLNLSLFVSTLHSQLAPIPSLNYLLGWGTLLGFTKSLLVLLRQTSSYSPTTSREKLSSRNQ